MSAKNSVFLIHIFWRTQQFYFILPPHPLSISVASSVSSSVVTQDTKLTHLTNMADDLKRLDNWLNKTEEKLDGGKIQRPGIVNLPLPI